MTQAPALHPDRPAATVIGAGIGGLATALRLTHAGMRVTVLERHAHVGGKMRTLPSPAGPVDAGPTVLTMRDVFDRLCSDIGTRLEDHVTLIRQDILARHFWPDGGGLDLHADHDASAAAIDAFAGPRAADEFRRFCADTRALFQAFDAPMMQAAEPSLPRLVATVLRRPALIAKMAPLSSLRSDLRRRFSDPRLAQLFARYATYVGGMPQKSPALLSLIWQAEAGGVWCVQGGMHRLALALARLAEDRGVEMRTNCHVERIELRDGRVAATVETDGRRLPADVIVFNGDPRALASGALGAGVTGVAPQTLRQPRSLSARVWSFAAAATGPDLAHHNVFFAADPDEEFATLADGGMPRDPTLYLCAEDRGGADAPPGIERFEIILNAAPLTDATRPEKEAQRCHQLTFPTLARFGLRFSPEPEPLPAHLTTPSQFSSLFPGSAGALYGQSPHGLTAALGRPRARTKVPGLYLAGGGAHPGAGVPMAALSGQHAAAMILRDRTSTSLSRPMATPGGMSTPSATAAGGRFRSSDS